MKTDNIPRPEYRNTLPPGKKWHPLMYLVPIGDRPGAKERTRSFFSLVRQKVTDDTLEAMKESMIKAGYHGEWALKHWMSQNTTWKGGRSANLKKPWSRMISAFWEWLPDEKYMRGGLYGAAYLGLGWGQFNIKPDLSTDTTGKNRQEIWVEVYKGKKELLPKAYIYNGLVMMRSKGRELVDSRIYQKSPTFESFLENAECNAYVKTQMLDAFQKEFAKRTTSTNGG